MHKLLWPKNAHGRLKTVEEMTPEEAEFVKANAEQILQDDPAVAQALQTLQKLRRIYPEASDTRN
jgi:hypothetical protein